METAKRLTSKGICDVCGKETEIMVLSSRYGPISLAYCNDCITGGYEPYDIMVAYISSATDNYPEGLSNEAIKEIKRQLEFHKKTEERFREDCMQANRMCDEFIEYDETPDMSKAEMIASLKKLKHMNEINSKTDEELRACIQKVCEHRKEDVAEMSDYLQFFNRHIELRFSKFIRENYLNFSNIQGFIDEGETNIRPYTPIKEVFSFDLLDAISKYDVMYDLDTQYGALIKMLAGFCKKDEEARQVLVTNLVDELSNIN